MEKIKRIITNSIESDMGKDVLTVLIVVLVGLGSFSLGRLSKQAPNEGLKIDYPGMEIENKENIIQTINQVSKAQNSSSRAYFASSKGSKYYSLGCSAGKTIKQENRVYFETGDDAEAAGYELSNVCK